MKGQTLIGETPHRGNFVLDPHDIFYYSFFHEFNKYLFCAYHCWHSVGGEEDLTWDPCRNVQCSTLKRRATKNKTNKNQHSSQLSCTVLISSSWSQVVEGYISLPWGFVGFLFVVLVSVLYFYRDLRHCINTKSNVNQHNHYRYAIGVSELKCLYKVHNSFYLKEKKEKYNNSQATRSRMKNVLGHKARSMKYSLMQLKEPQGVL